MFNEQSLIGSVTEVREDVNLVTVETADGAIVNAKWLPNGRPVIGLGVILNPTDSGGYTAVAKNAIKAPLPELPKPKPPVPEEPVAGPSSKGLIVFLDPKVLLLPDPYKFAEKPYLQNAFYNGRPYLTSTPGSATASALGLSGTDWSKAQLIVLKGIGEMLVEAEAAFASATVAASIAYNTCTGSPAECNNALWAAQASAYAAIESALESARATEAAMRQANMNSPVHLHTFSQRFTRPYLDWPSYKQSTATRTGSESDAVLEGNLSLIGSLFANKSVVLVELFNRSQGSIDSAHVNSSLLGDSYVGAGLVDSSYLWLVPKVIDVASSFSSMPLNSIQNPDPETVYILSEDQFKYRYNGNIPNPALAPELLQSNAQLSNFIKEASRQATVVMLLGSQDDFRMGHGTLKTTEFNVKSFADEFVSLCGPVIFVNGDDNYSDGLTSPPEFKSSDGEYTFWPSYFNTYSRNIAGYNRFGRSTAPRFSSGPEYGYEFSMWGTEPNINYDDGLYAVLGPVATYSLYGVNPYTYNSVSATPSFDASGIMPSGTKAISYSGAELNKGRDVGNTSCFIASVNANNNIGAAAGDLYTFGGGYFLDLPEDEALILDWKGNAIAAHFTPDKLP